MSATVTRIRARRAAAVRWNLPGARALGQQMAIERASVALRELRSYGPLTPVQRMRMLRLLDGTPLPGD